MDSPQYTTTTTNTKKMQGYKFNIFYPDLIDKSKPPTFRLEDDGSVTPSRPITPDHP